MGAETHQSWLCWPTQFCSDQCGGRRFILFGLIWDLIDSHSIDKLVKFPKKQSRILGETNTTQMLLEVIIKNKFLCYKDLPRNKKTISKHMYLLYITRLLCITEICKLCLLRRNLKEQPKEERVCRWHADCLKMLYQRLTANIYYL